MSNPSTSMQGTLTSVYNLGCFVGALSTIWSGDKLGRPKAIILGSSIIAIGAVVQTTSYSVPQMLVGRVVAGVGTGINTATAGVWQSETSNMRSRGKLIVIQMANCIFGVLLSNLLTLGFSFTKGSVAWRFPLAFQLGQTIFPSHLNSVRPFLSTRCSRRSTMTKCCHSFVTIDMFYMSISSRLSPSVDSTGPT